MTENEYGLMRAVLVILLGVFGTYVWLRLTASPPGGMVDRAYRRHSLFYALAGVFCVAVGVVLVDILAIAVWRERFP